jgi:RNA polymerase sigma-70 factor (ECF subfamily)
MNDIYAINAAKTEFREAYNTGDVDRLLSVLADGFADLSAGFLSFFGDEAKSVFLKRPAADPEAKAQEFEAAALPHLNDLFRTATRLVGSSTEAEDIVQETYLLAWKSFDRFEPGTNCRAWLFTIMFNAVHHYRRSWFDRRVTGETAEVLEETLSSDVLSALKGIPPEFRAVVLLADVQEFSYKEIAQILRVPMGTVMSRLSRGRALLRATLSDVARSYGLQKAAQEGTRGA